MKLLKRKLLVLLVAGFGTVASRADVSLPAIFSDHMVVQQEMAVPVWGWADPGEKVTVTIGEQTATATADAQGQWKLKLKPMKPGAPTTLTVKGKNTIVITDVLVGEVWLCSGQSNMAMTVSGAKDLEQEKQAANLPLIRHFREESQALPEPQAKCKGKWVICAPETVGGFTAAGYFCGRELHKALQVPVGLINSSVGGTPIESWTSESIQKTVPELQPMLESWVKKQATWDPAKAQADYQKQMDKHKVELEKAKAAGKKAPRAPRQPYEPKVDPYHPGNLFNGKINPLVPYAIRGALWYQGEHNSGNGPLYAYQLQALIKDWRDRWGQGEFPFAWVQLPNYMTPQKDPVESGWPAIRESMLKTLKVPNTGMAITIDVGEAEDIHPKNKQEVGRRLSLWALAKVYGKKCEFSGPLPTGHDIKGAEVICRFSHTEGGLTAKGGDLKGFAIAGADKKWVWANAKIVGDTVVVSSPDVKEPKAVRYAWASNPNCNLYNGAGLPASPFRTDDWPFEGGR